MRRILTMSIVLSALIPGGGCGRSGPRVHAVAGEVILDGGDRSVLTGHSVEVVLDGDPGVRAAGTISADGRFSLESLCDGRMLPGVPAGKYRARIVLSDDDPVAGRLARRAIPPEAERFRDSTWNFDVPTPDRVRLTIPARR